MVKKYSKPKKEPKYMQEEEGNLLLATPYKTNPSHILMLKFGLKCGLRSSEIVNIQVKDMEETIHKGRKFGLLTVLGKRNTTRTVPMEYEFLIEVNEYIKLFNLKHEDKLFDMTTRGFGKMVKRYGIRAGIDKNLHPHMLRHTFAVYCLKSGMNLRTLQKLLGHKKISTTEIYLDITGLDVLDEFAEHRLPFG